MKDPDRRVAGWHWASTHVPPRQSTPQPPQFFASLVRFASYPSTPSPLQSASTPSHPAPQPPIGPPPLPLPLPLDALVDPLELADEPVDPLELADEPVDPPDPLLPLEPEVDA